MAYIKIKCELSFNTITFAPQYGILCSRSEYILFKNKLILSQKLAAPPILTIYVPMLRE